MPVSSFMPPVRGGFGAVVLQAGKGGEVQKQSRSESAETRNVKGKWLYRLQVVQRRVTGRPKSGEASIKKVTNQTEREKETERERVREQGGGPGNMQHYGTNSKEKVKEMIREDEKWKKSLGMCETSRVSTILLKLT